MKKMAHALIALLLAAPVLAQEGTKFYRLDFVLKELDENKVVSQKTYSTSMSTDDRKGALIRAGTSALSGGRRKLQLRRCRRQYRLPKDPGS